MGYRTNSCLQCASLKAAVPGRLQWVRAPSSNAGVSDWGECICSCCVQLFALEAASGEDGVSALGLAAKCQMPGEAPRAAQLQVDGQVSLAL